MGKPRTRNRKRRGLTSAGRRNLKRRQLTLEMNLGALKGTLYAPFGSKKKKYVSVKAYDRSKKGFVQAQIKAGKTPLEAERAWFCKPEHIGREQYEVTMARNIRLSKELQNR